MAPPGKIGCLIWFSGDLPTKPSFQSYSRSYSTPPAAEREGQRNSDIFLSRSSEYSRIKLFQRHGHRRQTKVKGKDKKRTKENTNEKEKGKDNMTKTARQSGRCCRWAARKEATHGTDSGGGHCGYRRYYIQVQSLNDSIWRHSLD